MTSFFPSPVSAENSITSIFSAAYGGQRYGCERSASAFCRRVVAFTLSAFVAITAYGIFSAFSQSSLDIGVIVWFGTTNFMEAQKMKETLNLQILERFNAAGLSFAYPSVTNYIVEKK